MLIPLRRPRRLLFLHLLASLFLTGLLAGCGPSDRMDRVVSGRSQTEYSIWFARVTDGESEQERQEVQMAETEIKLHLMAEGHASGNEEVSKAFLEQIDGLTLRQFLVLGLGYRIDRIGQDRGQYKQLLEQLGEVKIPKGDLESANYFEDRTRSARSRLEKADADLEAARRRVTELNHSGSGGS